MSIINLLVLDLSHHDSQVNYAKVKEAGIVGIIYKATQGTSYRDDTYHQQREKAKKEGLLWGAYHFADASDPVIQASNLVSYADLDDDEIFCLDWEDYPDSSGGTMSLDHAKQFIKTAESMLNRPNEILIYSGNTAKEALGNNIDVFMGSRRLWLCQYGTNPVCQVSWSEPWLWQYSGDGIGPEPHTINGCQGDVDCNSYAYSKEALVSEWAAGYPTPVPIPVPDIIAEITITIDAPPNVKVNVVASSSGSTIS